MKILGTKSKKQMQFVEAIGLEKGAANWQAFELNPGEQIVGVYGSVNSAHNIRGLGFMVWTTL